MSPRRPRCSPSGWRGFLFAYLGAVSIYHVTRRRRVAKKHNARWDRAMRKWKKRALGEATRWTEKSGLRPMLIIYRVEWSDVPYRIVARTDEL